MIKKCLQNFKIFVKSVTDSITESVTKIGHKNQS